MTRTDEPSDRPEIGSADTQVSPTARWEMPRPRTAPDGERPTGDVDVPETGTPPGPATTSDTDAPPDPVTTPAPATPPDRSPAASAATDVTPVAWTGREGGVVPVPAVPARPVTGHWPRAAERRAAARQAIEDRAAQQAADDHAALLAKARRAAAIRDAANRAAGRAAARQSTRGRIRRFRTPVAAAVLGVAVVAATGTADAPVESPRSLLGPASGPPPSGVLPGPGVVPPVTASPATTTVPSTPDAGLGVGTGPMSVRPASVASALPDERARTAISVAMSQIGLPYVWGGDGPTAGDAGFDCSGLTHFAYGEADIDLPRTAHTQFRAGPRVPDGDPLQPGDLVFYGTYRKVHHVGMYIGDGRMVNAPTFGEPVQTAWYRWDGDDYIGATRPASSEHGSAPLTDVPAVPDPDEPPAGDEFVAPVAPRPTSVPEPREPQPREPDSAARSRVGSDADVAAGRVPAPPPATRTRTSAAAPTGETPTVVPGAAPSSAGTVQPTPGVAAGTPSPTRVRPPTARWTAPPEPPAADGPASSTSVVAAPPAATPPALSAGPPGSPVIPSTTAAPAPTAGPPGSPASLSTTAAPTPTAGPLGSPAGPSTTAAPRPTASRPVGPAPGIPSSATAPTTEPVRPGATNPAPLASRPGGPPTAPTVAAAPAPVTTEPTTPAAPTSPDPAAKAAPPARPSAAPARSSPVPGAPISPPAPSALASAHPSAPTTAPQTRTQPTTPAPTTPPVDPAPTSPPAPAHPPATTAPRTLTPPSTPAPPTTRVTPPSVAAQSPGITPSAAPTTSPTAPSTTRPPAATSDVDAALVVGTVRLPATPVGTGPGGLPAGPGLAHRAAGWIVQVRAPFAVAPGSPVTLRLPDGRTLRWTVESRSAPGPRTAATASDAPLTLLVPAAGGRWIVVTAR